MARHVDIDSALWEEIHRALNMSSRELADWLRTRSTAVHAERRVELEPTAGQEDWRHPLMTIGHDPLKPS